MTDNVTYTAPFVGGGILSNGTVQYDNSVWIWALLQESKVYRANAAPGFAAFTLFNALASIENQGNFNLVQALVLNVGVVHNRRTAGTSTTAQTIGVSFAAQTRAQVAGAVMTRTTGLTGFSMAPTYNTVAGSTVNLGTIRGMLFAQPAVPLFGSGAGTNNMTAYYGMDFPNMTFGGGSAIYSVVRSALNTGTNKRFLDHIGSASSRLRGHIIFDVDNFGVILGASSDALIRWGATSNALDFFFNSTFQAVEMSMPAAGRMLLDGSVDLEMNFNCVNGFSMGASTGPNGNQFGNWTTGARAVGVPGGYADFLLTQGANLDIGAFAMSDVGAWVLNAISLDNATGSIADLDTLTIGGMTTSNPGITVTRRSALRMTGRKYHRGVEAYPPLRPAALTGDVDDYAPATGNSMRQIWVLETDNLGNRTINGIVPQQTNDTQTIFNDSATDTIFLGHEIGSSAAGNRLTLPGAVNLPILPQEAVTIWHDDNDDRWKAINRV